MLGGSYALVGGFWSNGGSDVCGCPGDMNGDGKKDGLDVQGFVDCFVSDGSCTCADVNGAGGVTFDDLASFVAAMLAGDSCP